MLWRVDFSEKKGTSSAVSVWADGALGAFDIVDRLHPGAEIFRMEVISLDFIIPTAGELRSFATGEKVKLEESRKP